MSDATTENVLVGADAASASSLAAQLRDAGRLFYERRWVLGTSGNFSAVLSREPLRLVITSSGADKGALTPGQFVEVDGAGRVVGGRRPPSAETEVNPSVVRVRGARSVVLSHRSEMR